MNEKKTIVIIGGGIAGLSAGIYALENGFTPIIIEKHNIVGGLCTGWYRKGFYLDGCMHWLTGTKEGTELNDMWHNVGAYDSDDEIYYLDSWGQFEYDNQVVTFWKDIDRAEKEWLTLSPIDAKYIKKFFNYVRKVRSLELPVEAPSKLLTSTRLIKLLFDIARVSPDYFKIMHISCEEFASHFHSSALKWALTHAQPGDGNLYSMVYSYATIAKGDGGIYKGGSLEFANNIKKRYLYLGGTLHLNSEVKSLIIDKKTVKGVILKDGTTINGDYVVAACDANYVLNELLGGRYHHKISKRYRNVNRHPQPSCVLLHYAVKDMPNVNIPLSFSCRPFSVAGRTIDHMTIRSYAYDKKYVKNGYTVVQVLLDQYSENYKFWEELYKNKKTYNSYKNEVDETVKNIIIKRFKELKDKIISLDVATPMTLHRYVNSSRGAYMGFLFTKHNAPILCSGKVKGLKHFYLSGQITQCPGGLPLALCSGKYAIQNIRFKENLFFIRYLFKGRYNKKFAYYHR